jgi:preprotein translocase SecE subunit
MAVAVRNTPESVAQRPLNRLAVESLLGVLYVLGSLGIVFYGLPRLWGTFNIGHEAVQASFLVVAMLVVAGGLAFGGWRLVGNQPPRGMASGIFVGVIGVVVIGLFTFWIGSLIQRGAPQLNETTGLAIVAALGVVLVGLGAFAYFRPQVDGWLIRTEEQGWFSMMPYKRSQGQRVRRGTIMGILLLAGAGIFTLIQHGTLPHAPWKVAIPFTNDAYIILLPDVQITLPLLLGFAAFWLAYRVVNFPVFADFLIATEAELNKVSWTSRKRLIQDTIVVLVTVLLLTIFLFVVDQVWAFVLHKVGVVQLPQATGGAAGPSKPPF